MVADLVFADSSPAPYGRSPRAASSACQPPPWRCMWCPPFPARLPRATPASCLLCTRPVLSYTCGRELLHMPRSVAVAAFKQRCGLCVSLLAWSSEAALHADGTACRARSWTTASTATAPGPASTPPSAGSSATWAAHRRPPTTRASCWLRRSVAGPAHIPAGQTCLSIG